MKKLWFFLAVLFMVFTGCSKSDGGNDTPEPPLKNEYTYNGRTESIRNAYYQVITSDPFVNEYHLLFTLDELKTGEKYNKLEEFISIEFRMGKHLSEIEHELVYSKDFPSLWTVEGNFVDGFDFLGLSAATGLIRGGYVKFKVIDEGVFRVTFNIKVDASLDGGGFRYVTGEYGGVFVLSELRSY